MRDAPAGLSSGALGSLLLAVLIISVGYGVVLPILPLLVAQMVTDPTPAAIARHTGLLTAAYTLASLLLGPAWGHLSDRRGRRPIIVLGLLGFGVTLAASMAATSLTVAYAGRFLNGVFAAAVTPTALAAIAEQSVNEAWRARWFAAIGMAAIAGLLVGPMLGGLVYRWSVDGAALAGPFLVPAVLAFGAAAAVQRLVTQRPSAHRDTPDGVQPRAPATVPLRRLLVLAAAVASAVGAFEVGLTLHGRALAMTPYEIGIMFAGCSFVMLLAQALVFSGLIRPAASRWLILPALATTAAGLALVPTASSPPALLIAVAAVAAGAGVLTPLLSFWISFGASEARGVQLGWQTAATSLGQVAGSAGSGMLFGLAGLPEAPFLLAGAALAAATAASIGLASSLAPLATSFIPAPHNVAKPEIAGAVRATFPDHEAPR